MKTPFFDCEIIGSENPKFLVGVGIGKERHSFWLHRKGDMSRLKNLLALPNLTWVGFNSEDFDRPLIAAALQGFDERDLKQLSSFIINDGLRSWQTYRQFNIKFIEYDHIDLREVAPGVMISLKTYAGRMGYPTMLDMPFHHDEDLTPKQLPIVENYCHNDIGVTAQLFNTLKDEIQLRTEMSKDYGIDLRSKSDAQIAEAILKKQCGIVKSDRPIPSFVEYEAPDFIKTDNPNILEMIELLTTHKFKINRANGSPEAPEFLEEPIRIGNGLYQMGMGGLHSTHDNNMCLESTDKQLLSDFDVASYYPNIMMKAGLIPKLAGNRGEVFLKEYEKIYDARMTAKNAGNTKVANSLKITLNGTFGKLGNLYCSFYSPELMLAVTITGQLNLLCLISELEKIKHVYVKSANTDGVLVSYPASAAKRVQAVFTTNAKRTGFIYEQTDYSKYAAKDVNNYIALTTKGKLKIKGLYGEGCVKSAGNPSGKNPTMNVCGKMAVDYLVDGITPEVSIKKYKRMEDFVAIRNVKGGGVQHTHYVEMDDWEQIEDRVWMSLSTNKKEKRKSRPAPFLKGEGGVPFGRVARWYMTTENLPSITYVISGNQVPKTEGSKICLTLPSKLPTDLNKQWYIDETYSILKDLGL